MCKNTDIFSWSSSFRCCDFCCCQKMEQSKDIDNRKQKLDCKCFSVVNIFVPCSSHVQLFSCSLSLFLYFSLFVFHVFSLTMNLFSALTSITSSTFAHFINNSVRSVQLASGCQFILKWEHKFCTCQKVGWRGWRNRAGLLKAILEDRKSYAFVGE